LRESGGDPAAPPNIITNAIGGGTSAYIDFAPIEFPLMNDDIYLLSSDGMHDLVSYKEILSELRKPKAAEILTNLAKGNGGMDNISVITINVKQNP
jgi:serine/threonine protein phosphatase PrpC